VSAIALARELRALGFRLTAKSDGKLGVAPGKRLTGDQRDRVETHRDELVALVQAEALAKAPPPLRPLPGLPSREAGPVLLTKTDLAAVPGTPHAEVETDYREALARARAGYARHGGPPGGRDAEKSVKAAALVEALLLNRDRELRAWIKAQRELLEPVYAGDVALLPGIEGSVAIAWRESDRVLCQSCCAVFERPSDLPSHLPAQFCAACDAERTPEPAPKALQEDLFPPPESDTECSP